MTSEQWKVGNVTITKVVEFEFKAPLDFTVSLLPDATTEAIEALDWMTPTWIQDGQLGTSIHSFLIETPTQKILIDTNVGNGKKRHMEMFSEMDTDFYTKLTALSKAEDIDTVICTHLHVDHVGWNTHLVDGKWIPTFPNADYYFVEKEFDFWKQYADDHSSGTYDSPGEEMGDGYAVFEDSIRPVVDAGLVKLVGASDSITPEISLVPTFGHTPGHVAVRIDSEGESAIITGDLMYCPCQIARHDWSAYLDQDAHVSAETRKNFVEQFADTDTLVLGTHFDTPSGGKIITDGDSFKFVAS